MAVQENNNGLACLTIRNEAHIIAEPITATIPKATNSTPCRLDCAKASASDTICSPIDRLPLDRLKRRIPYVNVDTKEIAYKDGLIKELTPKNVIFNPPATIVFWEDGEKTVVKCGEGEAYDKEKGLAMAFCKRVWGNAGRFNNMFEKWCFDEEAK